MIFRNVCCTIFTTLLLTIAGAAHAQKNSGCGDGNGAVAGSDTMQTEGTIESVHLQDSMIVVNTQEGKDTVFFTSKTKFTIGDPSKVLRPDTQIKIYYTTVGDRKVATRVEPAATGGDGSKNDTSANDTGSAPQSTPGETPAPGE